MAFDFTVNTSRVIFRTAVRLAKMMRRVLRLEQDSMIEKRMLRTRTTRVTLSLKMFNLLQEFEERKAFLWLMMLSRMTGRDNARIARGTEALMMFQSQSSTSRGPSFHREELWQRHYSNMTGDWVSIGTQLD